MSEGKGKSVSYSFSLIKTVSLEPQAATKAQSYVLRLLLLRMYRY